MSAEPRWLPRTALEGPEIAGAIIPCLAEWSADWLAAGTLAPLGTWREADGGPVWPTTRRDCGPGLALQLDPDGLRLLAAAMLDRRLDEHDTRTPADRAVIDHVVTRALDDLAQRLEGFSAALPVSGNGQRHRLAIGMGSEQLFSIEAARDCLVAIAITLAGAPCKRAQPNRRDEAIRGQNVAVTGFLGRNRLLLTQLEHLGVGDVLPLMSDAAAPLDLVIGTARIPGGATLSLEGDHFTLQIERQPGEWRMQPV